MWISETESASLWLNVLTDIKARGVKDILIASTDNLTGIRQAIKSAFPHTITQLCVVHQIRNNIKYVVWKDCKQFLSDLKMSMGPSIEIWLMMLLMNLLKSGAQNMYMP
jgi:transposase-like protein